MTSKSGGYSTNLPRWILKLFKTGLIILLLKAPAFGLIYSGEVREFTQPDGSKVKVALYGAGEVITGESPDGYTLIRDKNGWLTYAYLNGDGSNLIPSRFRYSGGNWINPIYPKNIQTLNFRERVWQEHYLDHDDLVIERSQQLALKKKSAQGNPPPLYNNPKGAVSGLVLLVEFPDQRARHTYTQIDNFLNGDNYSEFGNMGSVKEFYLDVSNGQLEFTNDIFGYEFMPKTKTYYDANLESRSRRYEFIKTTLEAFDAQVDFSQYDKDNDGEVDIIAFLYTGEGSNWSRGIWPHRGTYIGDELYDGVKIRAYQMTDTPDRTNLFVMCHEIGHQLFRWPDLYGTGEHGLMGTRPSDQRPMPPNDVFRFDQGWITSVDFDGLSTGTYSALKNDNKVYRYLNPNNEDEYFLWTNRVPEGRWGMYQGSGILMYHFDYSLRRNKVGKPLAISIIQADGLMELDTTNWPVPGSEQQDLFYSPNQSTFSSSTNPKAFWTDSSEASINLYNISPINDLMLFSIGNSLTMEYSGLISDANNSGILDEGEKGVVSIELLPVGLNLTGGQLTLKAIDSNAQYVKSIGPAVPIVSQTLGTKTSYTFEVELIAEVPYETRIFFEAEYTDLNQTLTKEVTLLVQPYPPLIMTNGSTRACEVKFFDPGHDSGYTENLDLIYTIGPALSQHRIEFDFEFFRVDYSETTCENDYLEVYDGTSIQAPLIQKFCHNDTLDTIVPTNNQGALTFKFHSNKEFSGSGWAARTRCVPDNSVLPIENKFDLHSITLKSSLDGRVFWIDNPMNMHNIFFLNVYDLMGKKIDQNIKPIFSSGKISWTFSQQKRGLYLLEIQSNWLKIRKKHLIF